MKHNQLGFGGLQLLMVITVIAAISMVAVPKYNAFMTKTKLTEAFNIAGESKRKLSEFYMVNNHFPRTAEQAEPMKTTTLSAPEVVRGMAVEPKSENHDVMVKVFLKNDVVENPEGGDQFIYLAADTNSGSGYAVEWGCGARGIASDLLPEDCQG